MLIPKDLLVKLAADHYFYMHLHAQVRQDNNFRTYLWLASVAIATTLLLVKECHPAQASIASHLMYAAMLVAMGTFLFCLWHMRGRGDVGHPDLKAFAALVPEEKETDDEIHFAWLINQYWDFADKGKESLGRRTQALRVTTYLLSVCFLLLTLAGAALVPDYFKSLHAQGGEIAMADQKPAEKREEQPKQPPTTTSRNTEPPVVLERANNSSEGPAPELGTRKDTP